MTAIRDFADIGDPGAPIGSPEWCKYAHGVLCSSKRRTTSEVSNLKYALLEFKKNQRWQQLADDDGEPFSSWEDYVQYPEPNGLGMPPASAKLVMNELDDSRLLGDVLGKSAGRPKTGNKNSSNRIIKGGTNRAYIIALLERDGHTDLAAKVRSRTISAKAANEQAYDLQPPTPLDRILKSLPKLSEDGLDQVIEKATALRKTK